MSTCSMVWCVYGCISVSVCVNVSEEEMIWFRFIRGDNSFHLRRNLWLWCCWSNSIHMSSSCIRLHVVCKVPVVISLKRTNYTKNYIGPSSHNIQIVISTNITAFDICTTISTQSLCRCRFRAIVFLHTHATKRWTSFGWLVHGRTSIVSYLEGKTKNQMISLRFFLFLALLLLT